jgi:tyrosine-protein phosphatase YwqE
MWLLSNKVKIADSGLLEGFCDWHCHLLPGVDDGVSEMRESLDILERWGVLGVREVWLTPHIMEDIANETPALKERFDLLKERYKGGIQLHLASENMMDNLLHKRLAANDVLPIGERGLHLLVETSYFNPPIDMAGVVDKVKSAGYNPILAHPERYQYMDIGDYKKWKERGMLLQLNIPSLVGAYGPVALKKAEMLLEKGYYDLVGTDTHSMKFVDFFLNGKIYKKQVKRIAEINTVV